MESGLFSSLNDMLPDQGNSPAVECLVSKSSGTRITGSTHAFNDSIALRAG